MSGYFYATEDTTFPPCTDGIMNLKKIKKKIAECEQKRLL